MLSQLSYPPISELLSRTRSGRAVRATCSSSSLQAELLSSIEDPPCQQGRALDEAETEGSPSRQAGSSCPAESSSRAVARRERSDRSSSVGSSLSKLCSSSSA